VHKKVLTTLMAVTALGLVGLLTQVGPAVGASSPYCSTTGEPPGVGGGSSYYYCSYYYSSGGGSTGKVGTGTVTATPAGSTITAKLNGDLKKLVLSLPTGINFGTTNMYRMGTELVLENSSGHRVKDKLTLAIKKIYKTIHVRKNGKWVSERVMDKAVFMQHGPLTVTPETTPLLSAFILKFYRTATYITRPEKAKLKAAKAKFFDVSVKVYLTNGKTGTAKLPLTVAPTPKRHH
jgi:hypothetical protein